MTKLCKNRIAFGEMVSAIGFWKKSMMVPAQPAAFSGFHAMRTDVALVKEHQNKTEVNEAMKYAFGLEQCGLKAITNGILFYYLYMYMCFQLF